MRKYPRRNYPSGNIFLAAATAAAGEENDYSNDDPPDIIAAEKIAKTVIHK